MSLDVCRRDLHLSDGSCGGLVLEKKEEEEENELSSLPLAEL